jgi:hypothetical protein
MKVKVPLGTRLFLLGAGLKKCLCKICLERFAGATVVQAREILGKSENLDEYTEGGNVVFTAAYHTRRGVCCGSGCRHCPY